jgi:hypothetical protein
MLLCALASAAKRQGLPGFVQKLLGKKRGSLQQATTTPHKNSPHPIDFIPSRLIHLMTFPTPVGSGEREPRAPTSLTRETPVVQLSRSIAKITSINFTDGAHPRRLRALTHGHRPLRFYRIQPSKGNDDVE